MKRILLCFIVTAALVCGQKFASVSIQADPMGVRPAIRSDNLRMALQTNGVSFSHVSMWRLVEEAFPGYASWLQIHFPPDYHDIYQYYSLKATPPAGYKPGDLPKMMASMLVDKFGMASKTANAPTFIYSMRLIPGSKLTATRAASKAPPVIQLATRQTFTIPTVDGTPPLVLKDVYPMHSPTHYEVTGSMADLAAFLSEHTHWIVRDDTKTSGLYVFRFDVNTPNSIMVDITGHIYNEQPDRQWWRLVGNFRYALYPIGLELVPAQENLPVVIISHLEVTPK